MATGRVSVDTVAGDIDALGVLLDAELNISAVETIGGIGGSTSEPCHGFVHTKITGTATTDVDNAVAGVTNAAYIPGEVAEA